MSAVAFILAAAASCALPICTVPEVKPNIFAWDGRIIRVRGWLRGCKGGFDCQLGPTRDAEHAKTLTIDYVKQREMALGLFDGQEVILRAKVTDECSGENICVDRGPDLLPLSIKSVR